MLERIKESRACAPSDEDPRHGLTEDNQPVRVGSVRGALWLACCSDCSKRVGPCLLSPHSCDHSRLHVTAPRSNWPVTLPVLEEGGAGLCEAAMATGPFNEHEHAVTNDIPEPIGYTANGQFAASLTVLLNSKQAERTHLSGQARPVHAHQERTSGRRYFCWSYGVSHPFKGPACCNPAPAAKRAR